MINSSIVGTDGWRNVTVNRFALVAVLFCLMPLNRDAQGQSTGPDAVADPTDLSSTFDVWGCEAGVQSYSMRGGVCNIGDEALPADISGEHPMWATNFYRLNIDRFEHIGMSWVKHDDWSADHLALGFCGGPAGCINYGAGLDPGCTDTYSCQNGIQDESGYYWLGPRSQINPWSGDWPPSGETAIHCDPDDGLLACRLQVKKADIDQGTYSSAQFFLEQQVIMPGESTTRRANNVSWKEATIGNCSSGPGFCSGTLCTESRDCTGCAPPEGGDDCVYEITPSGERNCPEPAISAWKDIDSSVVETPIPVSNDGKFILATKAWHDSGCVWNYEYALYNMNSDRAAKAFHVPTDLSSGDVTNPDFHDIEYHSGEPYDSCPWIDSVANGSITWQIDSESNSNNALRWGTLYNFRFQAPREPNYSATVRIDLFKSGSPWTVTATSIAPTHGGACCTTGDACSVSDECSCTNQDGTYKGVYTICQDCDDNDVPDACEDLDTGACCLSSDPDNCVMTATSACCDDLNGQFWYGLNSNCETIDCSEGPLGPQQDP